MIDLTCPELVEVVIDSNGSKVWVNVDNECQFRAFDIQNLVIDDRRLSRSEPDDRNGPEGEA